MGKKTAKARTLDDVILYPDDIEDEKLAQVKCTKCGCINSYWKDLPGYKTFMDKGYGICRCYLCINQSCPCHTGSGNLPRILIRDVTLDQAFGVITNI